MSEAVARRRAPLRLDAGAVEDFVVGQFRTMTSGEREIGVIRLRNGEFRALRNRCPHKGAAICKGIVGGTWPPSRRVGELDFVKESEILVCPWHGYEYDLDTGAELYWDKGTPLRLYPTEIVDGRVVVLLPATRNAAAS